MNTINIGRQFSAEPFGRYVTDGPWSGELFREKFLMPALNDLGNGETLRVIIDEEIEAYGSSFLTEGFAGIVKYGYITAEELLRKIEIYYSDDEYEFYKNKIHKYIHEAKFNSKTYEPKV